MLLGLEKTRNQVEIYNTGSEDQTTVKTIAETVTKEMKLKNVKFRFTAEEMAEESLDRVLLQSVRLKECLLSYLEEGYFEPVFSKLQSLWAWYTRVHILPVTKLARTAMTKHTKRSSHSFVFSLVLGFEKVAREM